MSELVAEILRQDGITIDQLKLKGLTTMFFSKGDRKAVFWPSDVAHEVSPDVLNAGRLSLALKFSLAKGELCNDDGKAPHVCTLR